MSQEIVSSDVLEKAIKSAVDLWKDWSLASLKSKTVELVNESQEDPWYAQVEKYWQLTSRLALAERDLSSLNVTEQQSIKLLAQDAISDVVAVIDDFVQYSKVHPDFVPYQVNEIHYHDDYYKRLVLNDIFPEKYAVENLPASYVHAIDTMVEIWSALLKGDTAEFLVHRWERNDGTKENFNVEAMSALFASNRDKLDISDDAILKFKSALRENMLQTGKTSISMRYHPDQVLALAGSAAGLWIGMTSFPIDTRTDWDSSNDGSILVTNGRYHQSVRVKMGAPQKLSNSGGAPISLTVG